MINNTNVVVVTGVGGAGLGEQLVKSLRLSDVDYTIVGADINIFSKGQQDVDYFEILPRADDPHYINSLLQLCKKYNAKAVFYGSEAELKELSLNRGLFKEKDIFLPINSENVINNSLDKLDSMASLTKLGFNVPTYCRVSSIDDIGLIDFFPVILKPSRGGSGSANVLIAQTRKELQAFGCMLLDIYPEFIAQEYVGSADSEYTVGVLHSMNGEFVNSIAIRRQILSPLSNSLKFPNKIEKEGLGDILAVSSGFSQGFIGNYPKVTKVCEKIAGAIDVRGAVNIQCRMHNEEVFVFEINPRFSGTTSLRAMVGYNEPDILYRLHVLGEIISRRFEYKSGYIARGLSETFLALSDDQEN